MDGMVILAIGILAVTVYKLSTRAASSAFESFVQDDKSARIDKGQADYADIVNFVHKLRGRELRGLVLALQKRGDRITSYLR